MLYELLALKPPFSDASQGELFEKVVHENPRSIRAINPRVPPELETICQLALRKSRDDRYPSARAFADDLRRFLAGRNILARPPRLRDRARGAIVRRRTLVRAVPAALLLSLVGGIGTQRVISYASSRRARPKLRLSLEGQGGPARVRALPLADRVGRWGPPVEEASFEGGELQLSLPPGEYRIQVVRQDGAFAELRRRLRLHTEYPEPVRCAAIADVSQGMRKVPAGSIDVWLAAFDPETREGKVFEETLTYGDFLVDAACVTNRQFRQFALEGGVEPGRRKPWMEPPSMSGWEVLPATGMTWKESRDCAEWMGKRLPTIVEWAAAAIGPDRSWLSADVIRPETTPFVLGRPILALGSTADPNHSPGFYGCVRALCRASRPPRGGGTRPPSAAPRLRERHAVAGDTGPRTARRRDRLARLPAPLGGRLLAHAGPGHVRGALRAPNVERGCVTRARVSLCEECPSVVRSTSPTRRPPPAENSPFPNEELAMTTTCMIAILTDFDQKSMEAYNKLKTKERREMNRGLELILHRGYVHDFKTLLKLPSWWRVQMTSRPSMAEVHRTMNHALRDWNRFWSEVDEVLQFKVGPGWRSLSQQFETVFRPPHSCVHTEWRDGKCVDVYNYTLAIKEGDKVVIPYDPFEHIFDDDDNRRWPRYVPRPAADEPDH